MPPTLKNMKPFNIDTIEEKVFSKWKWLNSYVAVISETGIPDGVQIVNADAKSKFNIPQLPFVWHYDYSGISGKFTVKLMGDNQFSAEDAKRLIKEDLARISRIMEQRGFIHSTQSAWSPFEVESETNANGGENNVNELISPISTKK